MTYPFIPIGLAAVFLGYVLYSAFVKKNLKAQMNTVVFPGLFFVAIWGVVYFFLLK